MKKVILLAIVVCFMGANMLVLKTMASDKETLYLKHEWKKSNEGTWEGKDKVWYKLDDKAQLWSSKDGKKWKEVKEGTWQNKSGLWLKVESNKLNSSGDGGKTWAEVPGWQWEGDNGTWYRFDTSWNLWTMAPHTH
jgi:uncharacterized protein YxeA